MAEQEPISAARRRTAIALIVVAAVIGFISIFAVWVKRQALETDTWTQTSTQLLENEDIRNAVADFLVAELYDNVDVEGQLSKALPNDLAPLAGPAAGGLRELAGKLANEALSQPGVQGLWEDANRTAHEQLLNVLGGGGDTISTSGGVVTLNLTSIVTVIGQQLGIGGLAEKLPPQAADLQVLQSDELAKVQSAASLLRTLAWVLTLLTLALFALAVYVARGWRREALRTIGFTFIAVGILVLFARGLAGNVVTDSLATTAAAEPAVHATWTIASSLLAATGAAVIGYGLVIIFAAWLAGPSDPAVATRKAVTPYLRQPRFAYAGLGLALIVIFWWNPTEATRRLGLALLLIVMLALGVEVLRRQVIREFPDQVTAASPQGIAQGLADRMREARDRRHTSATPTPTPTDPLDLRLERLERLATLQDSGLLTTEEAATEKAKILAES